jgi:hypothetical protein
MLFHWATLYDWGGIGHTLVQFMLLALLETYRSMNTDAEGPKVWLLNCPFESFS